MQINEDTETLDFQAELMKNLPDELKKQIPDKRETLLQS